MTGVAITGVGAVSPLGSGADTLMDRWLEGTCAIEAGVGACSEFDPSDLMSKRDVRRTDRVSQLTVAAAREAFDQAGWSDTLPCEPERVGCLIGNVFGGAATLDVQREVLRDRDAGALSSLGIAMSIPNAPSASVAMHFGIKGPATAVSSACAAGGDAVGLAVRLIESGRVDAVVAGGSEAPLTPLIAGMFAASRTTSPSGLSRPFDARRDGFVLAEGAAVLVLESPELARARGAQVLGEVIGYGSTCDAFHLTAPDPSGAGAVAAVAHALADAAVEPDEVDYVNAHGTSTRVNDSVETRVLKQALGDAAARTPISSVKSAIGHLIGASGAIEAVATLGALRAGAAPPTLGYELPDEELDLDYVPDQGRALAASGRTRYVGISNSFGFGGHNCVLCLATEKATV